MDYDYGSETNNLSTRSIAGGIHSPGCTQLVTRGHNGESAKTKTYKKKNPLNSPFSNQPRDLCVAPNSAKYMT